ncbi:hypothetical protein [Amycolatopsis sp. FDAARGOS 1241]|nr:hypothetical protein [Amycolatopsis sp. FDAARGOS 1241]
MGMIEVAGARFGCDEAGHGPAVVLLHAGLADRRMWTTNSRPSPASTA